MQIIKTANSSVEIGKIENSSLQQKISKYNKIALLVDENTTIHSSAIIDLLNSKPLKIIEIKSGEKEKNLSTCSFIWEQLINHQFNRNDLLINLGGGVITDMGGFVASTYKRGIDFINIPTSLLSMVDASVGGKTGVNFQQFKNNIGLFTEPLAVFCDQSFLKTLPQKEHIAGIGEIFKHALILDKNYWDYCRQTAIDNWNWNSIIEQSVVLKNNIVLADPLEKNVRKKLNFGHTVGHAIESYFMKYSTEILHGEAVAIGLICESFISYQIGNITLEEVEEITTLILSIFPYYQLPKDRTELIELMKQDKKNTSNTINFTLLTEIGESSIDNNIDETQIVEALNFYASLN